MICALLVIEGKMIDVNDIYHDPDFNDFLAYNARRNLLDKNDYAQEVFAEVMGSFANTMQDAKRAGWRVAKRMRKYKRQQEHYTYIDGYDLGPNEVADPESVLWEDNHAI